MFVVLSPTHPDPMYKQVTDQIKDAIASGDLKPNDRLPSVRELVRGAQRQRHHRSSAPTRTWRTTATSSPAPAWGRSSRRSSATPSASGSSRKCRRSCAAWSGPARSSASRPATSSGSPGRWRRTDMDTVLEAVDLTKHYEDFSLRGVSLAVRRGLDRGALRTQRRRQDHAAEGPGRPGARARRLRAGVRADVRASRAGPQEPHRLRAAGAGLL